ncbi:hypothetical protein GF345_02130, partial [Candidatus Woesearchaeota archaeon]|nr:hypothetical protein [Candidatus Woesearchaeota archaeon]
MAETIKKEEWEDFLNHWHRLDHPVVPGRVSIDIYSKLIKKHVKGKKALLLGATWQIRDLLAELGFHVTVVDV